MLVNIYECASNLNLYKKYYNSKGEAGFFNVTGVDYSEKAIELAKSIAEKKI